jgi:hypothetical protein
MMGGPEPSARTIAIGEYDGDFPARIIAAFEDGVDKRPQCRTGAFRLWTLPQLPVPAPASWRAISDILLNQFRKKFV